MPMHTKQTSQIKHGQYIEVNHTLLKPFKVKYAINKLYIAKPLWQIALRNVTADTPAPGGEINTTVIRLLYLIETYFLLKPYLVKACFPLIFPTEEQHTRNKAVEIRVEREETHAGIDMYFRCADLWFVENTVYSYIEYVLSMKLRDLAVGEK
jgi:hypothetical protein